MIRRRNQRNSETREEMRGGSGKVQIDHFWTKDELKSNTRLCAELTLEPGCSIGFHEHAEEEEIFVILSGQVKVDDNGVTETVSAGDTILTGGGAGHSIEAVGSEPARILALIIQF